MVDLNEIIPAGTPNEHIGPVAPGGQEVVLAGTTYRNAGKELVELSTMYKLGLATIAEAAAFVKPIYIERKAHALYLKIVNPLGKKIIETDMEATSVGEGLDDVLEVLTNLK